VDRFAELLSTLPCSGTVQVDGALVAERNVFVAGRADGKVGVVFQLTAQVWVAAELAQRGRDIVALVKAPQRSCLGRNR
jgi:hypothetical protein